MQTKDYLIAGIERWRDSQKLNEGNDKRYIGTCYMAGYTLECILKYIIMKKYGLKNYDEVKRMCEYTESEKEMIHSGKGVVWFGEHIYDEQKLKEERGLFKALSKHKIDMLINLAVRCKAIQHTTRTTIKKSAAECYMWDSEWRYGKPYLIRDKFIIETEEVTIEKVTEFIAQVEWLINEIKKDSGSIEINLTA